MMDHEVTSVGALIPGLIETAAIEGKRDPIEIGKTAAHEAQYRRPPRICRLERLVGPGIIAPRRSSSADRHRPPNCPQLVHIK